jgi:hypothetical protein
MPRSVFRTASGTDDSFTPRPGKDTEGPKRGLSTFDSPEKAPAGRAHKIDLDLLKPPLGAIADGHGHISIVPLTEEGVTDDEKLREWAKFRKTGQQHPFTKIVLEARVEEDVKR